MGEREERGGGTLVFSNTIGSPDGLPEKVPTMRVRHAAVLEWLHGFGDGVGLHAQRPPGARQLGHRPRGRSAPTLRVAAGDWLFRLGYRFYIQGAADFFEDKYLQAPAMYGYYTSDKELGDQRGHIVNVDVGYTLRDWPGEGHEEPTSTSSSTASTTTTPASRLLPSRDSLFAAIGLRIGF